MKGGKPSVWIPVRSSIAAPARITTSRSWTWADHCHMTPLSWAAYAGEEVCEDPPCGGKVGHRTFFPGSHRDRQRASGKRPRSCLLRRRGGARAAGGLLGHSRPGRDRIGPFRSMPTSSWSRIDSSAASAWIQGRSARPDAEPTGAVGGRETWRSSQGVRLPTGSAATPRAGPSPTGLKSLASIGADIAIPPACQSLGDVRAVRRGHRGHAFHRSIIRTPPSNFVSGLP